MLLHLNINNRGRSCFFKKISDDSYVLQSNTDWSFENETLFCLIVLLVQIMMRYGFNGHLVNPLNATFYPGSAIEPRPQCNFEQLMFAIEEEKQLFLKSLLKLR